MMTKLKIIFIFNIICLIDCEFVYVPRFYIPHISHSDFVVPKPPKIVKFKTPNGEFNDENNIVIQCPKINVSTVSDYVIQKTRYEVSKNEIKQLQKREIFDSNETTEPSNNDVGTEEYDPFFLSPEFDFGIIGYSTEKNIDNWTPSENFTEFSDTNNTRNISNIKDMYQKICICQENTTNFFTVSGIKGNYKLYDSEFNETTNLIRKSNFFRGSSVYSCDAGYWECPCFVELDCSCLYSANTLSILYIIKGILPFFLCLLFYFALPIFDRCKLETEVVSESVEKKKSFAKILVTIAYFVNVIALFVFICIFDEAIRVSLCGGDAADCI